MPHDDRQADLLPALRAGLAISAAFSAFLTATPAAAHPLAPSLLEARSVGEGRFELLWRVPLPRARGAQTRVRIPEDCREATVPSTADNERSIETRWHIDCGAQGLVGREFLIEGLVAPLSAVVRVVFADGRRVDGLVTASHPRFVVPAAPDTATMLREYVRLGVVHIATGFDHLLFVFGLILLSSTARGLLATVTAFTVGHSVTLALAAFGLVRVPSMPIEFAIALSVFLVAVEVARRMETNAPPAKGPWLFAAGFGLLHGMGFASALNHTGMEGSGLVGALLAFNAGIELGQLGFVLIVAASGLALRRMFPAPPPWALRLPVYAMGTLAAYWCFDRAAVWWAW